MYAPASSCTTLISFLVIFILLYAGVYRYLTAQLSPNHESIFKSTIDIEAPSRGIIENAESHTNIISNPNPSTLSNIGYLGMGYDIVKGNPIPTAGAMHDGDHGFKTGIADFSYSTGATTADGRYSIPDNTQAYIIPACGFESKSQINTGQLSYAQSLGESVSMRGKDTFKTCKFSASESFQEMSDATYQYKNVYVSSTGFCGAYEVLLEPLSFRVNSEFIKEVQLTLPITYSADAYLDFIKSYGTHYAVGLKFGSQYSRTYKFSSKAFSAMQYLGWNIEETSKVSFELATGSEKGRTKGDIDLAEQFAGNATDIYETVLGSTPPKNGDISSWKIGSVDNPYPYKYTLASISDLITSNYISSQFVSESDLAAKRSNLERALTEYCGSTPGCANYKPDIFPQYIQRYKTHVSNWGTRAVSARCPKGSNVISCGFESISYNAKENQFWQVWPSDERSCAASSLDSANVYAVCAKKEFVGTMKTVSKKYSANPQDPFGIAKTDVLCPSGFGVTGCGIKLRHGPGETGAGSPNQVFPNKDGKSCHCQSTCTATCYAICSDSVITSQSTVYETSGTGQKDVYCTGEAIVFGCGFSGGVSQPPTFYVDGSNKCHGNIPTDVPFGTYKLTALCGTFGNNTNDDIKIVFPE